MSGRVGVGGLEGERVGRGRVGVGGWEGEEWESGRVGGGEDDMDGTEDVWHL